MHQIRFAPDPAVELTTLAGPTVGCEGRYPSLFTPSERLRRFGLGDWDASTLGSTQFFIAPFYHGSYDVLEWPLTLYIMAISSFKSNRVERRMEIYEFAKSIKHVQNSLLGRQIDRVRFYVPINAL